MSLHSPGGLLEDFGISRLSVRGQRAGLGGVAEKVVQQRRVVVGHVLPVTQTDLGVVAAAGSRGREVRGEKMRLEDRVSWMETDQPDVSVHVLTEYTATGATFLSCYRFYT